MRWLCLVMMLVATALPSIAADPTPAQIEKGSFVKTLQRSPGAGPDWRTLYDRYGRFQIGVPSDWADYPPDSYGEPCNLVASDATARDNFKTNLIVMQQDAPPGFNLTTSTVQKLASRQVQDNGKYSYKPLDQGFLKVNGVPIGIVGGALEVEGRKVRNLQLHIVHRGVYYIFTFTSLDRYFAQNEALFARLVRTLVFEKPDGTWPTPDAPAPPKPSPRPSPGPSASPSPKPTAPPSPSPALAPSPSPTP